MPFERIGPAPRRVAIVGGGISGLAAAWQLARDHAVVLFEAEGRLGGHARTLVAGRRGDQPVDTGFIVFNNVNYPNLLRMFSELEVPLCDSDMSFGASVRGGRMEYGLRDLRAVFAQPGNAVDPRFLGMLRDIFRFNARAQALSEPGMTIGDLLARLGTGNWFRDYYILPLSGAIWSTPVQGILDFPAKAMLDFFRNHALLSATGQHQWRTVRGGSVEYVRRLEAWLVMHGVDLRKGAPVAGIRRGEGGAQVRAEGGEWEGFDEVILATHSDDALRLLSDADSDETAALAAIRYQPNTMVLHADASVMPKRRAVWSSWNYVEPAGPRPERIDLTYWMNSLQPIPRDDPMFVTLNSTAPIRDEMTYDGTVFRHPVYDLAAERGRAAIRALNGRRATWFCGAWMRDGFHEDGFASAVDVVEAMRARLATEAAA
ncbi:MAG TPA: FAD-dependent oxidoreductase [Paracoccaceae bacterium]|nr:FAD-dependent oxidoreductase [Paracoccaceae bacterium]HMO72312.1 FAD-dependent oxidoreductase [Paracoccaceae bacterium]